MVTKWAKDNDPLGPAHVLKWYSFHGEVFKDNFGSWDWIISIKNEKGAKVEESSSETFNTMKEAKDFVEKQLFEYQTNIISSIRKS